MPMPRFQRIIDHCHPDKLLPADPSVRADCIAIGQRMARTLRLPDRGLQHPERGRASWLRARSPAAGRLRIRRDGSLRAPCRPLRQTHRAADRLGAEGPADAAAARGAEPELAVADSLCGRPLLRPASGQQRRRGSGALPKQVVASLWRAPLPQRRLSVGAPQATAARVRHPPKASCRRLGSHHPTTGAHNHSRLRYRPPRSEGVRRSATGQRRVKREAGRTPALPPQR